MSRFQIEIEKTATVWNLKVVGVIDEDARFEDFKIVGAPALSINMSQVKSINSCGIREWIVWIGTAGTVAIELHECPKVIVDQINMVQGFLPAHGKVASFFVPYFSEETGSEKTVLYRFGTEYSEKGLQGTPNIKDDSGKPMEIDVVEAKYFKFLQKAS